MYVQTIVGSAGFALPTEMAYFPEDPFSVIFTVSDGVKIRQPWVFARDLLVQVFEFGVAGIGNVRFEAKDGILAMTLHGDSSLTINYPEAQVLRFLAETAKLVPVGAEHTEIDTDLFFVA